MDHVDPRRSFVVSSWLFARALGVVLLIAFVSLGVQAPGLFGADGIAPIAEFVASAQRANHSFFAHPSLLWFGASDSAITSVWVLGAAASTALILGLVPKVAALVAWFAYLSFVTVGWPFMSFQWDTLLLEVTFISIFFVSGRPWDRLTGHREPNPLARWALWLLLVRLVFRSAWVKLASGDPTWQDLTALTYHYYTQPLPTVFAWWADQLPLWVDKASCLVMYVIEFGAPLLFFVPRVGARRTGAGLIVALMVLIALTGNYGFFNLLTVLLCLTAIDDSLLQALLPHRIRPRLGEVPKPAWWTRAAVGPSLIIVLTAVLFFQGTFGDRRLPGWLAPLYPWATLNNYGLFSIMTTTRPEIIIEGTRDGETWVPYGFRYKPGPLGEAPRWVAPHQPRLDWQMWFAALGDFRKNPWLASFLRGLLDNEPSIVALLEDNPFEDNPPIQVRAVVYDYEFTDRRERSESGHWWRRGEPKLYAPVLSRQAASPPSP
ncbi:MAG: lipase maturation factor family protein [Myxococcota bacterium]